MANFAKQKGNSFEYDCQDSLKQAFQNVIRTSERGYQLQYDIEVRNSTNEKIVAIIECKRLAGVSWNQLVGFYEKLAAKLEIIQNENDKKHVYNTQIVDVRAYLLFQSNRQPCLVFTKYDGKYVIQEFKDLFGVPFIKHKSSRSF